MASWCWRVTSPRGVPLFTVILPLFCTGADKGPSQMPSRAQTGLIKQPEKTAIAPNSELKISAFAPRKSLPAQAEQGGRRCCGKYPSVRQLQRRPAGPGATLFVVSWTMAKQSQLKVYLVC
jgi:hypothetical protein